MSVSLAYKVVATSYNKK
ncbi:uncharacterized protein FFNC_12764 [Fusarium fujikuroi]|nr:uncharacterized protein FFC1_08497 [Fusarium fujikuroi]SCO10375.1 uncharacterized protein FFE2_12084 [Fusarium fujikuroi]SCO17052.1 uncharacterized protein FFM5_11464 [Fusarium fujikuroi]SCO49658.1 uncharacterized protein FFNC_12764 [Fusarium fujikuroi]SCV42750.1 uncharacterized protein FFB14_07802 [Fusarium fujikuroi]